MPQKQILVLTGSPRVNGNSDQMAEAFTRGAEGAGHMVMKFEAGRKKIGGCAACKKCAGQGGRCVVKDDFEELVPLVEKAQVIVLASPLYSFALPAQIKAALDRFYCFEAKGGMKHIRESALLLCGGDKNEEHYQGAVYSYRQYSDYQGWKDRGVILAKGMSGRGDVYGHSILEKCRLLGKNI